MESFAIPGAGAIITNLRDRILKSEIEFPAIFTSFVEKDYGILFYNEEDKESCDSNHAILYTEKISDIESVLKEIKHFYLSKGLVPRIYRPYTAGYFEDNQALFEESGYEVRLYGTDRLMLLTEKNIIVTDKTLDIRLLKDWDDRIAADILIPNGEGYEVEVAKNSMRYKDNYLFAGYLKDEAVTTLYLHVSEYGCTRFDYINTAKKFRNKGYAREILSYAADFCKEHDLPNCYQCPAHETSFKMCYEAGFRVLFEIESGEAVCAVK